MKKILITGYNGLIGKSLVEKLVDDNSYDLIGIGRHESNLIKTVKVDLSKDWDENLLPSNCDIIIHLAQSEHFRNFPDKAKDIFYTNTLSTAKLADYATKSGAKKFIFASSGGIYGNRDKVFDEEDSLPVSDLGYYLSSKLCSEVVLDNYKNLLNVQILRFFFVYGKSQNKTMLIPRLVERIKNGEPIQLTGHEGIRINPIYVEDAVNALIMTMNSTVSSHINIAGSEVFSLKQLCNVIAEILSKEAVYNYTDDKPMNLVADISKMKMFYTPSVSLREGIQKLT